MDYQEAIELLKGEIKCSCYRNRGYCGICTIYSEMDRNNIIDACKTAISAMQELQEYKQLGTLEEVRDAVYRREPLKIKIGEKYNKGYMSKAYFCNHCNKFICFKGIEKSTTICHTYLFCNNCGQKLDWGESNE